ncbi:MAG: CoA transferase [Acidobacteria bacterium]|nr:CoA transferase [Acidobacteriota bacterium]
MESLPLAGVRILAFSQFGAGPFATLNLADLGAEVIKVEDPSTGGEVSRFVPPYRIPGDSLYFQSWNRNKRSITLNLRTAEGRQVLRDLARIVDVVFNNLRGDQPAKLGIDYAALGPVNPKIVCCSLNAFGSEGPRAKEPGYDYLMQAMTGYMSITGDPCGPPAACGVSFIDHAAGFAAAMAILSSLYAAEKTGLGQNVEVSLLDIAYSMLTYLAIWNLNKGFEPVRYPGSAHQTLVPVQTFRTKDGFVTIFCGKEKFWLELCEAFGDEALARDPRFATFQARFEHREEAVAAVQAHFLERTTAEWLEALRDKVPCAPVRDLSEALRDPELIERGAVVELDHPVFGRVLEVNTPVRFRGRREVHRRAPTLGEDTESILKKDLQYADEKIAALRSAGAI